MTPTLYAIAPVFNEEPNASAVIAGLQHLRASIAGEFELFVVFVDDGSTDGTYERFRRIASELPSEVLRHPGNLGPGAAFATAFAWLERRLGEGDWVLTMEGDATSTTPVILRMLRRRLEGYEIVLASPYMYGGGFSQVTPLRILTSQVANGLVKVVMGIRGILTFSCFLRLYEGAAVRRLQERFGPGIVAMPGFESMVELLGKITLLDLTMSEVEMKVDWSARKGKSKMKVFRTALGYFRLFGRWKALTGATAPGAQSGVAPGVPANSGSKPPATSS